MKPDLLSSTPKTYPRDARKFISPEWLRSPLALAALWFIATFLAFSWKRSQLLIGFDGGYMRDLARREFAWHLPIFSSSLDWFQGLGDIYFAVNFRLLPSFNAASLLTGLDSTAAKVVIYEVMLLEVTASIILFALTLGVRRPAAIGAAALTCLLFMPFAHPTLIYGILPLIPHIGSLIAAALLAATAYLQFGRRNWLTDLPFAAATLGLILWSELVSITIIMLAAPFFLLCAVSGIIAARNPAERLCKLALLGVIFLLTISGPAEYLVSTVLDTAAVTFPAELANDRATFFFASILFQGKAVGLAGPLLVLSAVAGAIISSSDRSRPTLRIFAITLLTYLGSRLTFAALVIAFDFWRGPAPLYFEFFTIPLYAIFAVLFYARMLERLWRAYGWIVPDHPALELRIVGVFIGLIFLLAIATSRRDYGFPYPPTANRLTEALAHDSALLPGSAYRGRTATMTGRAITGDVDWPQLHVGDVVLSATAGNEFRLVGLNYFNIPTLFQYTPTISPIFYAVMTRLLALPGDRQMRNIIVTRRINPRVLAMLGVRFVITDRPFAGEAQLRLTDRTGERDLFLYEIANPNLGNYSPILVKQADSASEILARMADPGFDPKREMLADVGGSTEGLTAARDVNIDFEGASLRLSAKSDARSVLLLPLEFSHCLVAESSGSSKIELFRANLLETGILFSGNLDVTLSVHTGAFLHPMCRLTDLLDARRLGIEKVPSPGAVEHD